MKRSLPNKPVKSSYIREILQATTSAEMISLVGGLPATSSFPRAKFRESASLILDDPAALQYSTTEGEPELRQWIANSLNTESTTRFTTDSDQILITNGAQQAMDLVARTFLQPGDKVVVESPAYLGALQVFNLAQANIIAIEQTATGPDLSQLESAFKQRPKLFYGVPDFHNPTGCCWSIEVRREVINLADKYGVTLLEDAPYRELRYSGDTLPSLYKLAPEQTCHIGSFSKVTAPGLRLGFLCMGLGARSGARPGAGLDAGLGRRNFSISDVSVFKQATDLHSSTLCQRLLLACLQEPFYSKHLLQIREDYRCRRDTLATALRDQLTDRINFSIPDGGMFLWLTINNLDSDQIAARALENNLAIVPGSVFYTEHAAKTKNKIRLNFTHATPALLIEGVKRLSAIISNL